MNTPPIGQPSLPQESAMDRRLKELGLAIWVISLIGSSTLTGLLTTLLEGPATANLAGSVTFISAALGGFALTLGAAFAWAALRSGKYQGNAAVMVAFVCLGTGILFANGVGIGTVGWDVVQKELAGFGSAPILKLVALVSACFIVYGFIPAVQAIVSGLLLGHWLDLLGD